MAKQIPIKGANIDLNQATGMIADFKKNYPAGHNSATFSKEFILAILAQEGCEYLRVYFGADSNNKITAILVGSDENDNDMLGSGGLVEFGDHSNPNPL
jgi:hypothetical protein